MLPLRVRAYEVDGKIYYGCLVLSLLAVVMKNSTLPFPFAKALDVKNQFLFQIILARFANGDLENADLQKVASQLKVTNYDCEELTKNNLYALNQVCNCNIAPENLEVSRANITMYTKHSRQEINATVCRVKYQSEQWHCGFGHDSSMDAHHTRGITIDLTVTASQCRTLARGGSITLKDETLEFKKGVKTTLVKHKDFDDNEVDLRDKLEPVQMIMTKVNGKIFSVSDLSCAYHHVPLSFQTQKLTNFIISGRQYTFTRGFYNLCGLPNIFSRLMTVHFDPLIKKKQAITYIDDNIMQSQSRSKMFTIITEYHTLLRKARLKAAPDKTFFLLKEVKFLGHVISPNGIQSIAKRVDALRNLRSPQSKRDVLDSTTAI